MASCRASIAGNTCAGLLVLWVAATAMAAGAASAPATSSQPAATRPVYAPDSPAQWLSVQGKSPRWVEATQRCRELLDKLDLDSPPVRPYLPNLRRQAETVRRVDGFTWKTITAVEFLQNALEDLLAGKAANLRYAGKQLAFPYWSDRMQRIEAVWMHVPARYDPAKSHQLFLYYKSGGGIHFDKGKAAGGHRPTPELANRFDTFHAWSSLNIQVKGRLGLQIELQEFPAALAREFSVSPDRVFLTGYSDGGFSALWLATHYPHLVAGIAPSVANWQYSNIEEGNLLNVPYLVVDGWGDGGYVEMNFLRFASLANMGCPVSAIFGQHGHTYAPFEEEAIFGHILKWASDKRRDSWPRRVRYATWNLAWNRAYWVSIDRMVDPRLVARIDAEARDANRIEVTTRNVAAYVLQLGEKLVDPAKKVTVVTDGKESYSGPYRAELRIELAPRPGGRFVKDARTPGDITAQIEQSTYDANGYLQVPDRRWLFVKGTAGDEETRKALGKWEPDGAKADSEISESDLQRFNLVVYGGPGINRFTARIAGDLPVKFGTGRFTIGSTVYDQPSHCVALLHPNPLNPDKYVLVYAFNDAAVFAANKRFGLDDVAGAWAFRMGDCVVGGIPAKAGESGIRQGKSDYLRRHIILDSAWRADSKAVGELAEPLDRRRIMQLRAAAIREAADADVGIVWQDTPGYLRWTDCLPAGTVTLSDLATIDALPQYIMTGQMTGADLVRAHPTASTLTDPAAPLATDQLDPARTYRVAMGSYGIPAYRTNPKQMPKTFTFSSEQEFLANENNSMVVRNMKQAPLEVTEAMASYIARRGTVTTQPAARR